MQFKNYELFLIEAIPTLRHYQHHDEGDDGDEGEDPVRDVLA